MTEKFVSMKNLKFLLYEVLDINFLTEYPYFQEHDTDTFDMILEEAFKMGRNLLYPVFREMDQNPPEFKDGLVNVHPVVKSYMKRCGDGDWISASFDKKHGGHQIPDTIMASFRFILSAANYSALAFSALTSGAAHLILSFGSKELIDRYIPNLFKGNWQGTMALTEPEAGSSLSDVITQATPSETGYYHLSGQKVFISAGDHDCVDNIIHLMLARIKGAPKGVKGISLFVVPRKRINKKGDLEFNDVNTVGLFHKMGYKGTPCVHISLGENDDCRGYLVGEPNRGLFYMFQMMNEARINVGLCATGIGSAAYYAALEYCKERTQGRRLMEKDPEKPQIPIIEHADIKRMLLFQKSVIEGSVSLNLYLSMFHDKIKVTDGDEKERYQLLLDILTPVGKSFPSEYGVLSVSQSLQCLGGYGYCNDFYLEQYYRDMRIHPIHEGTTGIQGMDLLGRKVVMNNSKALSLFIEEAKKTIDEAERIPEFKKLAEDLNDSLEKLQEVTSAKLAIAMKGEIDKFLADSTLYLDFFGIIVIAWQWLIQGIVAHKRSGITTSDSDLSFYKGKLHTCRFFFSYELPRINWLFKRLKNSEDLTVEFDVSIFDD